MASRNKQIQRTKNRFSEVPKADISRSTFNRSHTLKTAFYSSRLIPIFIDEALPGDTFRFSMNGFGRLATPVKPVMDNLYLETFFFAVPNRLVWDNWQRFNGEQDNPDDSTDFVIPTVNSTFPQLSLGDYFGLPNSENAYQVSALPFRAYNLCWNEFFRDQNLQDSIPVPKDDGPDSSGQYIVRRRGKRHDYFTSCLPWPQKGPAVSVPLGDRAQVNVDLGEGNAFGIYSTTEAEYRDIDVSASPARVGTGASIEANSLYTDLSAATAVTINALRQAFQIQKLLERDARGGTRYTEIIKAHFQVTSPDARLQRPEYLGGGSQLINISPVAQTSQTDATGGDQSPQGNLAAVGTVGWSGHSWTKSFTEHSIIIGMACVRADLTYQQGVDRMWNRRTRYDFFWPALQALGEQAVMNKEIYVTGTASDDQPFGYQERYAEYRYKPSIITGPMRSNLDTPEESLDVWHLAQVFENLPTLSPEFIQEDVPLDRVIAVQDEPHILMDAYMQLKCARPMPVYGVPGLIDHF